MLEYSREEDMFLDEIQKGCRNKTRKYEGHVPKKRTSIEVSNLIKKKLVVSKRRQIRKGVSIETLTLTAKGEKLCKGIYSRMKSYSLH